MVRVVVKEERGGYPMKNGVPQDTREMPTGTSGEKVTDNETEEF